MSRIQFETLGKLRHLFEKDPYQSHMNSAEIEAKRNIKFIVKVKGKSGEATDVLQKVMGTMP